MTPGGFWVPSAKAMADDQTEYDVETARRRRGLLDDHIGCGQPHSVWVSDLHFASQLKHGVRHWADERGGLVSYEAWSCEVLVSFKSKDDAIMFKLMFGGR